MKGQFIFRDENDKLAREVQMDFVVAGIARAACYFKAIAIGVAILVWFEIVGRLAGELRTLF